MKISQIEMYNTRKDFPAACRRVVDFNAAKEKPYESLRFTLTSLSTSRRFFVYKLVDSRRDYL
ncbi:MAG: hypothetical protein WAP52_04365 [Candidatus Sungiibacteriota bacterium]